MKSFYENERHKERKNLTVLFRKPSTKYMVPSFSIPFPYRRSVVSVFMKDKVEYVRENETRRKNEIYFVIQ